MEKSLLFQKLNKKRVQCQTCCHFCLLSPGQKGKCGVRENIDGELYSLNYGQVAALNIDPIEKKPFFHFLPGSYSFSLAASGCNFSCANCQNWSISQGPKINKEVETEEISPEKIISLTKENNLPSLSYTYTEPTVFLEYALEIMKLTKKDGLKNAWVTNGYFSPKTLELISPFLDAANVDLKSFSEKFYLENCGGRLKPVLENLKKLKEKNIWLEVTTLIIPTLSDDLKMLKKLAQFIKTELGERIPWHVTGFSGTISWKLRGLPDTPEKILKATYEIGKEVGLKYVYAGNLPGLNLENTFCPVCGKLMIERTSYQIKRYDEKGKCSHCQANLDLILE